MAARNTSNVASCYGYHPEAFSIGDDTGVASPSFGCTIYRYFLLYGHFHVLPTSGVGFTPRGILDTGASATVPPHRYPPCILISARRGGHSLYTRRFPLCLPISSLSDAWSQQNTRATSGVEYRHQVTFEIQSKRQLDGSPPVEQYLFSTYVFHTICF